MARIADAEKLNGKDYWTVYDGKGGVYHAKRDGTLWYAYRKKGDGLSYHVGRTLRDVRQRIANGVDVR